ncbi:sag-related sequence srs53f [Cystoisospora suis]|uniref:Sag-related sequence srs53f n=1 Tax=Cystoisospora suis TaxID=483139 RepID=A0A2C6L881_9APIC|nr:sag-related sequence srs53f [Cystoisospora suis]
MDRYIVWCAIIAVAVTVPVAEPSDLPEPSLSGPNIGEVGTSEVEVGVNERRLLQEEPAEVDCIPQDKSSSPAAPKTVTIGEYTYQARINCGSAANAKLDPPADDPKNPARDCYPDATCAKPTDIAKILGGVGGTVVKNPQSGKYIVTLDTIWNRKKVLYYKCKEGDTKECLVAVKLPPVPKENKCILYKQIELKITESQKSVNFICEEPGLLEPVEPVKNVYDGRTCGDVMALSSLVPTSRLENQATPDGTLYTLSVDKLPATAVKLCYVCKFPEPADPKTPTLTYPRRVPCPVLIDVEATTETPTGKSVGSTTLASGVVAASTLALITTVEM